MIIVTNAFSINMLQNDTTISFQHITLEEASEKLLWENDFVSAVGHADTAAIFTELLGFHIPMRRESLKLNYGFKLLVGQYKGPRLPEGVSTLPDGATIEWWFVTTTAGC